METPDDILRQARAWMACRRCECLSCTGGEALHEHVCTKGKHCVESVASMLRDRRAGIDLMERLMDLAREASDGSR